MNYPDNPIFNEEKDSQGNEYLKAYSNKLGNCVFTFAGKNQHFQGRTNLFIRKGKSKFGKELCFYFKIDKLKSEYLTPTKYDCVEFYLPEEYGIEFLEQALTFFKSKKVIKE